jgi:predicted aldo/keto reductase-like oxidoreductase
MPAPNFNQPVVLGRTGLKVGRLGIASGYRAPTAAIEEAFERGCNYLTWGTFMKGRVPDMGQAIRNIVAKGQRDRLVLGMFSYAHMPLLTERLFVRGLKETGIDHADVLILGFFSRHPSRRIVESALRLKERRLVRFVGLSGHNRKLFPKLCEQGQFDVFHVRYSAAHRGAETETFPYVRCEKRPGIVAFTATRWGQLLNSKKMPAGEAPATAADCYRFVLSNPAVDVSMTGAKTVEQMRENLKALEMGPLSEDEMARMRRIGDFVRSKGKAK